MEKIVNRFTGAVVREQISESGIGPALEEVKEEWSRTLDGRQAIGLLKVVPQDAVWQYNHRNQQFEWCHSSSEQIISAITSKESAYIKDGGQCIVCGEAWEDNADIYERFTGCNAPLMPRLPVCKKHVNAGDDGVVEQVGVGVAQHEIEWRYISGRRLVEEANLARHN